MIKLTNILSEMVSEGLNLRRQPKPVEQNVIEFIESLDDDEANKLLADILNSNHIDEKMILADELLFLVQAVTKIEDYDKWEDEIKNLALD
jgi:hypothetical protein